MADERQQYKARVERAKAANVAKLQTSTKTNEAESSSDEKLASTEEKYEIQDKKKGKKRENIDNADVIKIEVPDECLSYGRPPKYLMEKGIAYAFKKLLNVRIIFE